MILFLEKWEFAFVYLDDVLIFLQAPKKHITHVLTVLALLQDVEVSVKRSKGLNSKNQIVYLGPITHLCALCHIRSHRRGDPRPPILNARPQAAFVP